MIIVFILVKQTYQHKYIRLPTQILKRPVSMHSCDHKQRNTDMYKYLSTYIHTHIHTNRHMDKQTERFNDRQTDRRTDGRGRLPPSVRRVA